jgi:hypothetical protein
LQILCSIIWQVLQLKYSLTCKSYFNKWKKLSIGLDFGIDQNSWYRTGIPYRNQKSWYRPSLLTRSNFSNVTDLMILPSKFGAASLCRPATWNRRNLKELKQFRYSVLELLRSRPSRTLYQNYFVALLVGLQFIGRGAHAHLNILRYNTIYSDTINNYWMRSSKIWGNIKAEVCVICRRLRLRTQTLGLINSSYPARTEFNNCFIIYL